MRRLLVLPVLALAGLAATPAHADAPSSAVPILYDAFGAPRVDVLAGDTVTWRNDSLRPHAVVAVDRSWSSERIVPSTSYSRQFDAPGAVGYFCPLHPSMRGEVDVHRLLLAAPKDPAAAGRPYTLSGRAALPKGATVSIEAGGVAAATAEVDEHGAFSAQVKPSATTTYTAVAGGEAAPPVQVLVLDRKVSARARGRVVTARVAPASPGATVVLQLRLKEHFGWWPIATRRLDARSHVRFTLPRGHEVRARVVLTTSDGATPLAQSAVFSAR